MTPHKRASEEKLRRKIDPIKRESEGLRATTLPSADAESLAHAGAMSLKTTHRLDNPAV